MTKVSKKIVIFPQKFKSVTLSVDEADSFDEADQILKTELQRYDDLIEPEDKAILKRILGGK